MGTWRKQWPPLLVVSPWTYQCGHTWHNPKNHQTPTQTYTRTLKYRWENKGDRLGQENWINKPLREQGQRQPWKRIQFSSHSTLFASMLLFNIHFLPK